MPDPLDFLNEPIVKKLNEMLEANQIATVENARVKFGPKFMTVEDHNDLLYLYQLFNDFELNGAEVILKAYAIGFEAAQASGSTNK